MEHSILVIELPANRQGNPFGLKEARVLEAALKAAQKKSVKCVGVMLIGRPPGRVLCTGGNLVEYAALKSRAEGVKVNQTIRAALAKLERLPLPTIAVVTGDCFGGGVELISCFDRILCVPHCFFGIWQRRNGLSFGWGGAERLVKRMPASKLKQRALDTLPMSSYEALETGLVDEILPLPLIEARAQRWLLQMGRLPQAPLKTIKEGPSQNASRAFDKLWGNPEHLEKLKKYRKS